MTQTAVYTEQQFIADIREAFATHRDSVQQAHTIATLMRRAFENGWPENSEKFGDGNGTFEIYRDTEYGHPGKGFVVLAYRQGPQELKRPAPHDHGVCWVAYGVKSGGNTQTRYAYRHMSDDSELPTFEVVEVMEQGAGDVHYILPGEIHSVQGSTTDDTIYCRLTSMDLDNVQRHRYDVESGRSAIFSSATTPTP